MGFADSLISTKKKLDEENRTSSFADSLIATKQLMDSNPVANTVNTINSVQPTVEQTIKQPGLTDLTNYLKNSAKQISDSVNNTRENIEKQNLINYEEQRRNQNNNENEYKNQTSKLYNELVAGSSAEDRQNRINEYNLKVNELKKQYGIEDEKQVPTKDNPVYFYNHNGKLYKEELVSSKENGKKDTYTYKTSPVDSWLERDMVLNNPNIKIERRNEKKGLFDEFNNGYQFGDITKTIGNVATDYVGEPVEVFGESFEKDPLQTLKTSATSIGYGLSEPVKAARNTYYDFMGEISGNKNLKHEQNIINTTNEIVRKGNLKDINNRLEEIENYYNTGELSKDNYDKAKWWLIYKKLDISGTNKEINQYLTQLEKEHNNGLNNMTYDSTKTLLKDLTKQSGRNGKTFEKDDTTKAIESVFQKSFEDTETYKKHEKGELDPGQESVWNTGIQVSQQIPAATIASVPVVGPGLSKVFFWAQAQDNYYNEAKERGYDDPDARKYGIIMSLVETGIEEREGINPFGGVKEIAKEGLFDAVKGEAFEEFITPYIDYGVRRMFGEKYDLGTTLDKATQEGIEGAVSAAITTVIMSSTSKGLVFVDNVANKIENGEKITTKELVQAARQIEQNDPGVITDQINIYLDEIQTKNNQELQEVENQDIKDAVDSFNLEEEEKIKDEEKIEEKEATPNEIEEEIQEEEEQQETTPTTTELELNLENQTQNQTRNNINIAAGLEDYIKNNNLTELTQKNIDDYINQILEEQQANLTEQERKSLIDEYQDIIKDYAKDNGIPVIGAPKIEIPDMTAESKAPSKAIGRETRNEIKNQVNAFNNAVKSDQYKVGNQVKEQYKNLEQKSINKLDNDALKYNLLAQDNLKARRTQEPSARKENVQPVVQRKANVSTTIGQSYGRTTSFANQVDDYVKGKFNRNNHLMVLKNTPSVLLKLGVKDNPITLAANKLDRIMNKDGKQNKQYHDLGIDIVKQLPEAIKHPLDIVKSHDNSYVLTTYLTDKQGRQVIASIKLDGKGNIDNIEIDSNVLTSAYGRNNYDNWMKKNKDNVVYDVDRGYLDTKKGTDPQGLQLSKDVNSIDTNISQKGNNVKLSKEELDNSSFSLVQDSQGRKLTKEQQEIFKDESPELLDRDGNLMVLYHGTPNEFAYFDETKSGERGTDFGAGIYLTSNKGYAQDFAGKNGKVMELYAHMTNPYIPTKDTINADGSVTFAPSFREDFENKFKEQLPDNWKQMNARQKGTEISNILKNNGYDGIIVGDNYIAFKNNQIKSVDNLNLSKENTTNKANSIPKQESPKKAPKNPVIDNVKAMNLEKETKKVENPKKERDNLAETKKDEVAVLRTPTKIQPDKITSPRVAQEYFEESGTPTKVAKILSEKPRETNTSSLRELYQTAKRLVVDKGEAVYRIAKQTKNRKLYAMYDRIGLAAGEGNSNIGNAQADLNGDTYNNFTNSNGEKVSMSLNDIWNDVEKSGIPEDVMNEYLAHYLNVDRYKANQLTLEEQQELKDLEKFKGNRMSKEQRERMLELEELQATKNVFGEGVTNKDSLKKIKEIEEQYPEIKRPAQNIWQYGKNQLQKMVDAGLVSKESQEYYNENTPHYVRLQRSVEKTNSPIFDRQGHLKVNNQIKAAKGGTADIIPFKDAMAQYTLDTTSSIRKNLFGQELSKTLQNGLAIDGNIDIDNVDNGILNANDDGSYTFTIYEEGKPKVLTIDKGIYEALQPNKHYEWEKMFTPLKAISNFKRTVLTDKNPLFMATNFFKDFFDAPLNTKHSTLDFIKNYGIAIKEVMTNGEYYQKYKALGGEQNTYFDRDGFNKESLPLKEQYKKIKGVRDALSFGKNAILTPIEKGNTFIESLPRMSEFITSLKKGESLDEAMYNAAEITTNFKRGGELTKLANRNGATFLNASVQGFDKQIRNFTEIQNPKQAIRLMTKALVLGVAPALLNAIMYDDDDEYEELPDYIKDSYYLFKTGKDDKWVRIPKGRAISVIQAAARRTYEYAKGDKDAYKGLAQHFTNQLAPNNPFDSNVISPFIQAAENKSWSGNKIVSDSIKNETHPEEEYDAKTDELSKWLGKITKQSPKKINYIIDQNTGGIGDLLLPFLTKQAEGEDDTVVGKLLLNPVKDKFTTDATLNSKNVNDFYDAFNKATDNKNWSESTDEDSLKYKYLYATMLELGTMNKEIKSIESSNLSDSEKYKQTKEIKREMNTKAKNAVENADNIKIYSSYAQIDDKVYKKDYDKETGGYKYTKVQQKQLDKLKEQGVSLVDYFNEQYEKQKKKASK